jgi:hypothetical protein
MTSSTLAKSPRRSAWRSRIEKNTRTRACLWWRGVRAALGLPLGLGTYLLFKAMSGGGYTGFPPPLALALIALAAIAIAAAAGALPALLAQRVPANQALAAE